MVPQPPVDDSGNHAETPEIEIGTRRIRPYTDVTDRGCYGYQSVGSVIGLGYVYKFLGVACRAISASAEFSCFVLRSAND